MNIEHFQIRSRSVFIFFKPDHDRTCEKLSTFQEKQGKKIFLLQIFLFKNIFPGNETWRVTTEFPLLHGHPP